MHIYGIVYISWATLRVITLIKCYVRHEASKLANTALNSKKKEKNHHHKITHTHTRVLRPTTTPLGVYFFSAATIKTLS